MSGGAQSEAAAHGGMLAGRVSQRQRWLLVVLSELGHPPIEKMIRALDLCNTLMTPVDKIPVFRDSEGEQED